MNGNDSPSGYQVASTNVAGAGGFLDIFKQGIAGLIDVEIAKRAASTPDRADVADLTKPTAPQPTPLLDTLTDLGPTQYILLGVAGLLTVGLFAGWFR